MRLKAGLIFLGATCGIFSLGALVAPPWAGATNIDVSVSSSCVGASWQVVLSAHNTHTTSLRVVNDNSVEKWGVTLAPGEEQHARINPPGQTFHYVWSSPDGHLVGTTEDTLTRPDGCGTPPPTSGVTTTTTCAQAIPPRSDCEVTTSPSSTSPTTAVSPPPTSTSPASPVPAVGQATSTAPATVPSRPTTSIASRIVLPTTGWGSTIVWVAVALLAVGTAAILITVRRRRP